MKQEKINQLKWGIWSILSFMIVFFGILAWVLPNVIAKLDYGFDQGIPLWALTIFVNPVGVIFGVIGVIRNNRFSLLWTIVNAFLTISFIPMFYLITWLYGP
ncbi:hypothetical protein JIR001_14420 [Polycladomyces abyssicola]|uniref:Uncharacterized protein n=1 Tax=Polycladomyces abyssicola TaxID=1125966 RepID=A0A8D5ZKN5_9BACL|nr:hypothetical protein [Polycladomyces abyssicola]BCU81659.1 hypothetical protein JIR001_14420 [Polycladomyces abyssicola]